MFEHINLLSYFSCHCSEELDLNDNNHSFIQNMSNKVIGKLSPTCRISHSQGALERKSFKFTRLKSCTNNHFLVLLYKD